MPRKELGDIAAARLDAKTLARNFDDVAPPLDRQQRPDRRAAAASTATTRRASRPARPASTSRVSSAHQHRQSARAPRPTSSAPTSSAACARGSARPKSCAKATACATPTRTSRCRSARSSATRPTGSSNGTPAVFTRERPRATCRGRRRRSGRTGLRACGLARARPRGHDLRGPRQTGGLNEYGIAAYKVPTALRSARSTGCCRSAASPCETARRWAAISRSTPAARLRRRVPRPRACRRERARYRPTKP
jgi:hypothetical protein